MKLVVVKTGFASFDTLHACGLAIVFAEVCDEEVLLQDQGPVFELTLSIEPIPKVSYLVLKQILRLPDLDELLKPSKDHETATHFLNLDGLLATTINLPGPRTLSITELLHRPFLDEEGKALWLKKGYEKVSRVASRLISGIQRELKSGSDDFLNLISDDYLSDHLIIPKIEKYGQRYLPIWSTFEPALGFSTRSSVSDCELNSYNLTISGNRFASFLALVGAARILRAQKTDSRYAVYWLPSFNQITIVPGFAFQPLRFFRGNANLAILSRTMDALNNETETKFIGLHYHILQGSKQPVPVEEGEISLLPLRQFPKKLVKFWRSIATSSLTFDDDLLSSALFDLNYHSWERFLLSWHDLLLSNKVAYPYSLDEILEVNHMLDPLSAQPLSAILNEKAGTRKFGVLLRQLNEINRSEYLEAKNKLIGARSPEEILAALCPALDEILVIQGKKATFRVIPTNADIKKLLEQIESHGVSSIAHILIILASLHYRKIAASNENKSSGNSKA